MNVANLFIMLTQPTRQLMKARSDVMKGVRARAANKRNLSSGDGGKDGELQVRDSASRTPYDEYYRKTPWAFNIQEFSYEVLAGAGSTAIVSYTKDTETFIPVRVGTT